MAILLEFIITVLVGAVAAVLTLGARGVVPCRLPLWAPAAAAALAMAAFTLWSDYGWAMRARADLPETAVVADTWRTTNPVRPWSYVVPLTTRLVAVDSGASRRHPDRGDIVLARVLRKARRGPDYGVRVMFDCTGGRRADLLAGTSFEETATLREARWRDVPAGDPVLRTVCDEI